MSNFKYIRVEKLIKLENDKKCQVKKTEYLTSGILPIVDQSSQYICGFTNDLKKSYSKPLPVIVFGDHTLQTKYVNFNFAAGADGTQIIKSSDSKHDDKYIYYLIFRESQRMYSQGYKRHFNILKERIAPFTSNIHEQMKIAVILTSLDEVIENTQKQIDKLQDLKRAMMNELFPKDNIPLGWNVVRLGDLSDSITKGTTPNYYSTHGVNFIKIESISANGLLNSKKFSKIDTYTHQIQKRSQLKAGDIMFAIAGSLGKLAKVTEKDLPANTNQAIAIIRLNKKLVDKDFLFQLLVNERFQKIIGRLQTVGAQPNLSLQQVSDFQFLLPSLSKQKEFASIFNNMDNSIETVGKKFYKLQALVKSLIQDLLTGKVRVKV